MLLSVLEGGMPSFPELLLILFTYAVLIFVTMPVHELAHAFVADRLGDKTARWNGRLTFNPLRHLDPIGSVLLVLVGFGYAKAVPVNPRNFKNPRSGMALTALAGPLSNVLMAFVAVGIFRVLTLFGGGVAVAGGYIHFGSSWLVYAYIGLIQVFASVNLVLAVFNLLPIPPLDGSRILGLVLPDRWLYLFEKYYQIIMLALFVVLFLGWLDVPLSYLRHWLGFLICTPFGLPNLF